MVKVPLWQGPSSPPAPPQPLPRVLERAASRVTDFTAFGHAGNEKVEALEQVHARHRDELKRATDAVALERVKLAEAMARLAADEEQGRVLADFRRESASGQVVNKAAIALATAEEVT